ncbi:MAG TPA: RAD55 family ATPase [Candidatus Bathyarchaeia archaeon]
MIVQLAHASPLLLVPVLIGILTLFGKKKKEDKTEEPKQKKTPGPLGSTLSSGQATTGSMVGEHSPQVEDTSLNRILQMLMQDMPVSQPGENDEARSVPSVTPNWVPPRATPPSRPMVILPGDKGKKLDEETVETTANEKPSRPEAQTTPPNTAVSEPKPFSSFPKLAGLEDEVKKLEEEVKRKLEAPEKALRPEKVESAAKEQKQEKREPEKRSTGKPVIGLEHLFELTKGALESPGLVLATGPQGSGKTTICSALTAGYLRQGTSCLFVTYDRSPTEVREAVRKLGCDISNYESQFRFLLIDGFSAQTESFSMEPYYVERPFDLVSLQEILLRNVQVFMGELVAVVLDSLDGFLSRVPAKEFVKGLREIVEKLKESGAILIATADSAKLSKDFEGPLNEMAGCSIELEKSRDSGGRVKVQRVGGSAVKSDAEAFEFDQAKGLVFV